MKIKAIITGSTGMVGKGLLLQCLENSNVESVLVINRQSLGIQHEKLKEIIHPDFFDLTAIVNDLKGYNTCFFCLGVSSNGLSEQVYHKFTYDLTLNFAQTFEHQNPDSVFCYVSGSGTDMQEKSRMMWARVKGKTEKALLALPFKAAYMFRPGFIEPMKGVRSRTPLYNFFITLFKPIFPILRLFPGIATTSQKLSKSMINCALSGYPKNVLESRDINILSKN
jgi:hypothetical protein